MPINSSLHTKIEYFNTTKQPFNTHNSEQFHSPNSNSINNNNNNLNYNNAHNTGTTKSASTSYLLSKISSLASLTLPKSSNSSTGSSLSSSSASSYHQNHNTQQTTPPSTSTNTSHTIINSGGNSLMTNLANKTTKFFNRKNSQQQMTNDTSSSYMLSSSSSNSIGSPNKNDIDTNPSSPLTFSIHHEANQRNPKYSAVNLRTIKSSTSAYMSHNNSNNNNTILSRRPFKKRSQSNHVKADEKIWFFNQVNNKVDFIYIFYNLLIGNIIFYFSNFRMTIFGIRPRHLNSIPMTHSIQTLLQKITK